MKTYAGTKWTAEDVLSLSEAKGMTLEQAEEFLEANERRLRDRLIETGFAVISDLLVERKINA